MLPVFMMSGEAIHRAVHGKVKLTQHDSSLRACVSMLSTRMTRISDQSHFALPRTIIAHSEQIQFSS